MSLNIRIDKENVTHLHNRILTQLLKNKHSEICRQIDVTRKSNQSHREQGNPFPEK